MDINFNTLQCIDKRKLCTKFNWAMTSGEYDETEVKAFFQEVYVFRKILSEKFEIHFYDHFRTS